MQIQNNLPSGIRPDAPRTQAGAAKTRPAATKQAEVNFIPSDTTLLGRIKEALANIKRGIYPDRGSILNVLV